MMEEQQQQLPRLTPVDTSLEKNKRKTPRILKVLVYWVLGLGYWKLTWDNFTLLEGLHQTVHLLLCQQQIQIVLQDN